MTERRLKNLLQGRSFRNGASGIVAHGTRTVLQVVIGVALARLLLPEAFGTYSYLMSIITIAAVLGQFGMAPILLRDTAKYVANDRMDAARSLWIFSAVYCFAATIIVCAILYVCRNIIEILDLDLMAFSILSALVFLLVISGLLEAILQGLGHPMWPAIALNIFRPAAFLGLVIGAWLLSANIGPLYILGLQVASQAAVAVAMSVLAFAIVLGMPGGRNSDEAVFQPVDAARSSLSFLVIHGLWVIVSSTDMIMIGALAGAREAGLYRVASSAAALIFIGMIALNPIVSERTSSFASTGNWASLERGTKLAVGGACALALPLLLIFLLAGRNVLGIMFGEQYAEAGTVLSILAVGQFLHLTAGYSPAVLAMTGGERVNLLILALTAGLNLVLNVFLIPELGATGAAVSTASALTLQAWLMREVVRRRHGFDTSLLSWLSKPMLK